MKGLLAMRKTLMRSPDLSKLARNRLVYKAMGKLYRPQKLIWVVAHKPCLEDKQSFSSHKPGLVLAEVIAQVMPFRGRPIRGVQVTWATLGCMLHKVS